MPRKPGLNVERDILNEKELRALIRRLRNSASKLDMFDRTMLADTLEEILCVPAVERWRAAIGAKKRGRPSTKNSIAKHEGWKRRHAVAERVAAYRDGKGPDGIKHSITGGREDSGAIRLVAEDLPDELKKEILTGLEADFGAEYVNGKNIRDVMQEKAEGKVRQIWEEQCCLFRSEKWKK